MWRQSRRMWGRAVSEAGAASTGLPPPPPPLPPSLWGAGGPWLAESRRLEEPCGEQELEGELIGRVPTVRAQARMLHPVLQVRPLHCPGEVAAGA